MKIKLPIQNPIVCQIMRLAEYSVNNVVVRHLKKSSFNQASKRKFLRTEIALNFIYYNIITVFLVQNVITFYFQRSTYDKPSRYVIILYSGRVEQIEKNSHMNPTRRVILQAVKDVTTSVVKSSNKNNNTLLTFHTIISNIGRDKLWLFERIIHLQLGGLCSS